MSCRKKAAAGVAEDMPIIGWSRQFLRAHWARLPVPKHLGLSNRTRIAFSVLLGVGLLAPAGSVLAACDQPAVIDFTEFPIGTTISNQYAPQGITFSGGPSPFGFTISTFIAQDFDGTNYFPALTAHPQFFSPVWGTFVDPNNPSMPAVATNISLTAGYFDALNSTAITFYDINGNEIQTDTNGGYAFYTFSTGSQPAHSFLIRIVANEPAGFAIDKLSFSLQNALIISTPKYNQRFSLDQNNTTGTSISYQANDPANSGQITWNVTLEYATTAGYANSQTTNTFTSGMNTAVQQSYQSTGGRLTINASESTAAGTVSACPVKYAYIVGSAIPDNVITSQLLNLYSHGATPNLLTGIASVESSYQQFSPATLYGYSANWPKESYDGGSHVGLMQMPTSTQHAWDWLVNASDAAALFSDKLAAATRIERRIRKLYHGLHHLTDVEIENMALVLYGPYASADLTQQYYAVEQVGRKWAWVVNTAGNPDGIAYADNCRASVR